MLAVNVVHPAGTDAQKPLALVPEVEIEQSEIQLRVRGNAHGLGR